MLKQIVEKRKKDRLKIKHDHPVYLYCISCGTGGAKEDGHNQIAINIHSGYQRENKHAK